MNVWILKCSINFHLCHEVESSKLQSTILGEEDIIRRNVKMKGIFLAGYLAQLTSNKYCSPSMNSKRMSFKLVSFVAILSKLLDSKMSESVQMTGSVTKACKMSNQLTMSAFSYSGS